jgi:AcrR family transcriptional regulator
MPATRTPLASSRASVRREREREIVEATRALFDLRGLQDAPIEEIAREVGINKALIYRHFSSKEELYVLTLTSYLAELAERLDEVPAEPDTPGRLDLPTEQATPAAPDLATEQATPAAPDLPTEQATPAGLDLPTATNTPPSLDAVVRLEAGWRCYTDFCLQYPAFVDCGLSLMRQPAAVLRESVSDSVWLRLGLGMAACLGRLSQILAQGAREGAFEIEDADFTANHLYTQTLGTMQLARIGVGVRGGRAGGVPEMFEIDPLRVQEACIADVLAAVGAHRARIAG